MRSSSRTLGRVLEAVLEQLAIRTEDGKLIYQDMLCMSWAAVCDQKDHLSQKQSSKVIDVEAPDSEFGAPFKR
jgi:hypothetical protein